jgi:D-alanine-D-alanine ligase
MSPTEATPGAHGGRVVVLAGGLSHERDVSLRSGRRVAEALRGTGQEVEERDVDAALLPSLAADPPACVVPMLHGETGEDGAIREVLELLGLPYVGASPEACRIAFDKPVAKTVAARAGVRTPASFCLPHETFRELGAAAVMESLVATLGLPLMVKPARSGSALGCTVVRDRADLPSAMVNAFAYGPVALLEQFVEGAEVAVAVIDDGAGPRTLPLVGIEPDGGVYDYTARYTAGSTQFVVPARLDDEATAECERVALAVHEAFGLRDLSRSDLIVDPDGTVWFLEVNVAPGFTETSTVPLAVQAAGLDLGKVIAALVHAATTR